MSTIVSNPYSFTIKDNKNIYAKLKEELTLTIIFNSGELGSVSMNSKNLLSFDGSMDTTTVVYKYSELGDLSGMIRVYYDGVFGRDININSRDTNIRSTRDTNIRSTYINHGTWREVKAYIIDPTISAVFDV